MTRRFGFPVLVVFVAVALAAAACSKESPSAPTAVPTPGPATEGAFDTSSGGTTVVGAVPRPGAVDVKGIIKSISLDSHTFVLVARNDKEINVRVTQRTLFAAGPNPRAKLTFRSLKVGMAVDVVGKMDKGVLVAHSVVVLKLPPRPGA